MNNVNTASQRIVASLVTAFGLLLVIRWISQAPAFDFLVQNAALIGLDTPLMFVGAGVALFLSTLERAPAGVLRVARQATVAFVAGLSVLILIEHVFGVSLGIDFVRVPIAPTAETPTPGRVAPNTCCAFLLAAAAMHLASRAQRTRTQRRLMVASAGGVMLIASTALIGHFLDLSALYRFAQYNSMLAPTAVGLFLLSIGLWFMLQDLLDGDDVSVEAFERRITRRSAGILAMVAISTGVAGFAVLEAGAKKAASQHLLSTAVADGAALSAALESRLWFSQTMQTRPSVAAAFAELARRPGDRSSRALLDQVSDSLLSSGVTAVRFADTAGTVLAERGVSTAAPAQTRLPLTAAGQTAALVWNGVFLLQTETDVVAHGELVGRVWMEQALPNFNSLIAAAQDADASLEVVLCARTASAALCAPSRFFPSARTIPLTAKDGGHPASGLPAALDRPSLLRWKDVRGVATLAAYTPLQRFGIGMTLKVDADSLAAPLRVEVVKLGLIITGLVALGALLARLQIRPLLARLVYEQTRSAVILANSNDAFIGMDAEGRVTDWNASAEKMFAWPAAEAVGQLVSELIVPQQQRHAHTQGVAHFKLSGQGAIMNRQIEVVATRRDGALFPVELSVTGFHDGKSHIANAFVRDISARKASEKKLADRERFIRTITDNLPAVIGYVDMEERYLFANSGYRTVLGLEPGDIIGKTITDVFGAASRAAIAQHIDCVKGGTAVHFERRGDAPGRPDYMTTDYIPDIAPDGTVVGFFIHIVDISAKKNSELALKQSEQRLKAITDNLPALITHVDRNERYQFVNAYVSPVFGIRPEEMVGHTVREIGGEHLYAAIAPHVQACLSGQVVNFDGTILAKGKEMFFQANYVPEFDLDGLVTGFYAMTFDITDRKREELLRKQSERRLRLITDNLPVLISYLDAEHKFQFGNATFSTWLGTDPAQLVGKYMADIVGPEAYAERKAYLDRAFTGETVHFDMTTVALGVRRVLQTVYVPHLQDNGAVDGLYTISTDVTALKDIEQELALQARVDTLTGLPNRRQFDERMDEALARYLRAGSPVAVMFLDVDKFKGINDSLGHAAGDQVLRQFAERVRHSVRRTDLVARYAGDEFVIIIDGFKAPGELALIAKKILAAVRKPMVIGGVALHVTASIGITSLDARDQHAGPIIARADAALYSAKKGGRDAYREWTAPAVATVDA